MDEYFDRTTKVGGKVFRGTILTHPLETGMSAALGGSYPTRTIAGALRRLGQGIKVALIRSKASKRFLELAVLEILAKPRA